MPSIDHEIGRLEGLDEHAIEVLKTHGAIAKCTDCGEHEVNGLYNEGVKATYAQVTREFKRGEIDGSLEEILHAVRNAMANVNIECPDCKRDHGE
ncbi:hypothetical protein GOFOIKOB_1441 [Methylobacterium tardum]|uniref:Uncharacterized protein n=1 Tax=Methylobacterium tardum TaxID=374432 RepID=A0AA37TRN4_9HYPH|nr:hypothetical protein [Methylobacterium tardum]URD34580.1 hypothetical protein M6G65_18445 [Methylobacterium tardum]GJE48412.1 hypothetical protein GOFOIKOB_1441 [Methylobacterium tardum]GLS73023.1 hypothetical protein GCM10007890_50380 [Methylobacterium tardum]